MKFRADKRGASRRKAMAVAGAVLAATAFVAPPAAAAPTSVARCANNVVRAKYNANVYSGWNSFRVVGYVTAGVNYRCNPGYKLGRRYTACGVSDGNGWIALLGPSNGTNDTWGYSPQGCFVDQ